jgi:hypothetical protein
MPDADAQRAQVESVLRDRYFQMIPQLPQNWTAEQHEKNRLSRSLAAFAIEKLADAAPAESAHAIVDGGNDNGIDALYLDRPNRCLWLVQSKAGGAPDSGDNKKFCDGIRDLVSGRFDRFNASFDRLRPDVEEALATYGLQLVGCHVHLGDALGAHAVADLELLKEELNRFHQRFDWRDLTRSILHRFLTAEHAVEPVRARLMLENWYAVTHPRRAFYGLVSASQLAELYQRYGKRLFEKNIRHYLGERTVNADIGDTVRERPGELFYLNNGLTAVCSAVALPPGAAHERGEFTLENLSIVNGAQTVGSIAAVLRATGTISADAKLLLTVIEIGTGADDLGPRVTRARNTQNAIQGLHFAGLDPQQERLRQELAVSGVEYHYRPSAEVRVGDPAVITLERAAVALACFTGDTETVVAVKKERGQLYDLSGGVYSRLFGEHLSGVHVNRVVRIFEYLDGVLDASEHAEAASSRRRMFYRHGRFFVLHILARRHRGFLDRPDAVLSEDDRIQLSRFTLELAELIFDTAEARFGNLKGYLSVFRNTTDAVPLAREVMERLARHDAERQAEAQAAATAAASRSRTLESS